ncbi:MAG: imidazole glycerol phosphate synthase subunit HisH [Planctomycetaceae bacterium]|nr:imidazole glycerol phosphate synthase subunit HisH [Planctomycetaceae bacterium]
MPGLGWIAADTRRFDRRQLSCEIRIPHMGWTDTEFRPDSPLFSGVRSLPRYYYVHSYHMICDNAGDELCHAVHGYRFTAGVERENIFGVQFHPEKSHQFGMQLLKNFASHISVVSVSGKVSA